MKNSIMESGVRSQESGVRSQESGVRSQESGVRTKAKAYFVFLYSRIQQRGGST